MAGTKIGELNGKWAILLKLHLVAIPPIIGSIVALTVWLVVQQFADISFRESSERFSQRDAYNLEERTRERDRMMQAALMAKIEAVDSRLDSVERNLERVLVILERVEKSGN